MSKNIMTALSLFASLILSSCVMEDDFEGDEQLEESTVESELAGTVTCTWAPDENYNTGYCTASSAPTGWTSSSPSKLWIYNAGTALTTNYRCTNPTRYPGPFLITATGVGTAWASCKQ